MRDIFRISGHPFTIGVDAVRNRLLRLILLSCFSLVPAIAFGQAKVGTTGVNFLKVGVGARAVGMGEAFVAVADDATALYFNPAGLIQLARSEATFNYIAYPAGLNFVFLGGAMPVPLTSGVVGVQVTSMFTDEMVETTIGQPYGTGRTFTASDLALGFTYCQRLTEQFSVGGTGKFLQEVLADKSATGWSADVGTFYDTGWKSMKIGMIIQNFGPDMNFENSPFPLPISFKFGASILAIDQPMYNMLLVGEFTHPNDNVEQYNFGLEFTLRKMLSLRVGKKVNGLIRDTWHDYQDDSQKDPFVEYPLLEKDYDGNVLPSLDGFSFGLGVMMPEQGINFDYAWAGMGTLGNIHRFSVSYNLSNILPY